MKNKQQLLTEPIKRFLIQCVAKAGPTPERLLNELELCERFSVSRRTAHKAVSDLLDLGCIQHLEGKRGIFSNPDYATVVPFSVGITGTYGNCSYMDMASTAILGEILRDSINTGFMTTFLTLNASPAEIHKELLSSGLDAVLWFQPAAEYLPAIQKAVMEMHFPILVIGNLSNGAARVLPFNTLNLDHSSVGEQYGEYYRNHPEYKNLLFCGRESITLERLQACFLKDSARDGRTLTLFTDSEDPAKLPWLLKEKKIDSLLCNGCNNLHHRVFKTLSALKTPSLYSVLLSPGLRFTSLQKEYPLLTLHAIHKEKDPDLYSRIGNGSVRHLKRMLQRKEFCFENEYFQWNLQ